jgi:hypothetical protein
MSKLTTDEDYHLFLKGFVLNLNVSVAKEVILAKEFQTISATSVPSGSCNLKYEIKCSFVYLSYLLFI